MSARHALEEVWSWGLSEVLDALRYEAEHRITLADLDRWSALRGLDFAAGLLVSRAIDRDGWEPAHKALLDASAAALSRLDAPPLAFGFLSTAHEDREAEGTRWESVRPFAEAARDRTQAHTVRAAARIALALLQLPEDPDPASLARDVFAHLFRASPPEDALPALAAALSVLERHLAGRQVAPESLETMAWRGGAPGSFSGFSGLPASLVEVRCWGPGRTLRALSEETERTWTPTELEISAGLDGADLALGHLLGRVEREHGASLARALLREARMLAFRLTGADLSASEALAEAMVEGRHERGGRALMRALAGEEIAEVDRLSLLEHIEGRVVAMSGNGGVTH